MIDFILLLFLVICAVVAVVMKDLLSSVVILGGYSLTMVLLWTRYNAVDVAFTEAAVGAGITTVLLIAAISRTMRGEEEPGVKGQKALAKLIPLLVVLAMGAVLFYSTLDMPDFGDPHAPAHLHVAPHYIERSVPDMGIVNYVTTILANYRGYDTLGETTVIFAAGICVVLLLRWRKEK